MKNNKRKDKLRQGIIPSIALTGAGLGTAVGGIIGTVIGAGIGAGVGIVARKGYDKAGKK